jgi:thymidylate kinase
MFQRLIQRYDEMFETEPNVVRVDTTNRCVEDVVTELLPKL